MGRIQIGTAYAVSLSKSYISERVEFRSWLNFKAHDFPTGLFYQFNTSRVQVFSCAWIMAASVRRERHRTKCNRTAGEHLLWHKVLKGTSSKKSF